MGLFLSYSFIKLDFNSLGEVQGSESRILLKLWDRFLDVEV